MILPTPAICAVTYDLLLLTKPFCNWKMPPAEDVRFKIVKTRDIYADCDGEMIRVSSGRHGNLFSLLPSVAHEMIHMMQMENGLDTPPTAHNADFHKRAKQVCRLHGFDLKAFL